MPCTDRSVSFPSLLAGSLVLLLASLFHVIGYGLPRWFTIQITVSEVDFKGTYHMGLWQDCTCTPECYCVAKLTFKGWQRAVQAMQTLALIGFITSGILCLVILFRFQRNAKIKIMNIVLLLFTGICSLIGLLVFATQRSNEYEELIVYLEEGAFTETHLNSSFILSVIATSLCLLFCVPLFLINLRTTASGDGQQGNEMTDRDTNRG